MNRLTFLTLLLGAAAATGAAAGADAPYVSKVWVADQGNGTYKNPVLNADYSDPDVVAVGDDYYLTSSSFCNSPGLPILHSKDLVNWTLIGYALRNVEPLDYFNTARHGDGVWAPSIRYHDGEFYIYYGDPDHGVYMVKTKDPAGEWEKPVLVLEAKGVIDTCPLWDEDGKAYLVNGWAKSRAGFNAALTVTEMSADGTHLIGDPVLVYDGLPDGNHTIEGPKFYKHDGWYYILAPAGSVAAGWQVALRSRSPYGPYEQKIVMAQGGTDINGPHQGGWVRTPEGEDWFLHFQDKGIIGRVVHLNPMSWKDGWPVIGVDKDGDGCGEPVKTYRKPKTSAKSVVATPAESDEFNTPSLGLQWEWFANYHPTFGFPTPDGYFRLYGHTLSPEFVNMREVPNLLTQKFPNETFTATAKVTVSGTVDGQRAGLLVMGLDYGGIAVTKSGDKFVLSEVICKNAHKNKPETVTEIATLPATRINGEGGRATQDIDLWFRVKVDKDEKCTFFYSTDGKKFTKCPEVFQAREGHWIGARVGFFATQPKGPNRGWIDIDWFRVEK